MYPTSHIFCAGAIAVLSLTSERTLAQTPDGCQQIFTTPTVYAPHGYVQLDHIFLCIAKNHAGDDTALLSYRAASGRKGFNARDSNESMEVELTVLDRLGKKLFTDTV